MAFYRCMGGNGGGGGATLITKSVTANGTYNAQDDNADGYSQVSVAVPSPTLVQKNITQNGTYNPQADNADGYSQVTVNVPSSPVMKFAFTSATAGSNTFTATEAGTYLVATYHGEGGSSSISSSVTPEVSGTVFDASNCGLRYAIYNLAVGDTVDISTTAGYNSCLQAVINMSGISVSALIDSTYIHDGTINNYSPTYTGEVLTVSVCGGNQDDRFWDKTIITADVASLYAYCGYNSCIRVSYGELPNINIYGYYGNGAMVAVFQ